MILNAYSDDISFEQINELFTQAINKDKESLIEELVKYISKDDLYLYTDVLVKALEHAFEVKNGAIAKAILNLNLLNEIKIANILFEIKFNYSFNLMPENINHLPEIQIESRNSKVLKKLTYEVLKKNIETIFNSTL